MAQTTSLRLTIRLFTLSVLFLALPVCGQSTQPDSAQTILKPLLPMLDRLIRM